MLKQKKKYKELASKDDENAGGKGKVTVKPAVIKDVEKGRRWTCQMKIFQLLLLQLILFEKRVSHHFLDDNDILQ